MAGGLVALSGCLVTLVTHARVLELLNYDSDTGRFTWRVDRRGGKRAGDRAGSIDRQTGYLQIRIDKRLYYGHRLAWFYVTGNWPTKEIDHRDGFGSGDRFKNLREASHQKNLHNQARRSNNTSGATGVHWQRNMAKWFAYVTEDGRRKSLGYFESKEDAIRARAAAAACVYGEFAPAGDRA